MMPQWTSMLSAAQWALLALVPPAIFALYFLRLRRTPLVVPSTYLWKKTVEDLHVNSLWQRLRRNLLLWLQLALVGLLMLAAARPSWQGTQLTGGRYIFVIDNSASMQATDVAPSRLDEAKRRALALVREMNAGDVAMVVSFADTARVEQSFTEHRAELERRIAAIEPTHRPTDLGEALRVSAGLANPGQAAGPTDAPPPEPLSATVYLLSDGNFPDLTEFPLGNLSVVYVPIGEPTAANVGITVFSAERNAERPERMQAFARLENFGPEAVQTPVRLLIDGTLADADTVSLAAHGSGGTVFDLGDRTRGRLELVVDRPDALAVDNRAWAVMGPPRRARVLLAGPGNRPLELALDTAAARRAADVRREPPAFLSTPGYRDAAAAGAWDLVIYDRCRPEQPPQANTLFVGAAPAWGAWRAEPSVDVPQIIDVDRTHPLMHLVEMGDVLLAEGTPLARPPGGAVLIDSQAGPLFIVAPRDGFEDAVLGFPLETSAGLATNWPVRRSFPVFALNVLGYLGGGRQAAASASVRPGQSVVLRPDTPSTRLTFRGPQGRTGELLRNRQQEFLLAETDEPGVYELADGESIVAQVAVNLFDPRESHIVPRPADKLQIGGAAVADAGSWQRARIEAWPWLVALGLAVLVFEWWIYNRRVYL